MNLPSTHQSLLWAMMDDERREDAWRVFHLRYRDVIDAWCRRRGLEAALAEDLTQDVLLKLFRRLAGYDPSRGRFRSWLKTVVENALTDYFRKRQRRGEVQGVGGDSFHERIHNLQGSDAAEDLSVEIERQAQSSAAAVFQRVRARIKSEITWQSFLQTMVEERPAREVAEELGVKIDTVYKNTQRVKKMVAEEFLHA